MSNKQFFLRMAAALNAGDAEHIAEWFTDDFKLHEPGVPLERVTGHAGARYMLHQLRTAIVPEAKFEALDMVEEGDRVAVRWQFSGIKDGQPVVMPSVAIYRFVDGRIAEDLGCRVLSRTALAIKASASRFGALGNSIHSRALLLRGDRSRWRVVVSPVPLQTA